MAVDCISKHQVCAKLVAITPGCDLPVPQGLTKSAFHSRRCGDRFQRAFPVLAQQHLLLRWAGIAKAKAEGVYKGRKPTIDAERIKALAAQGMGATAIARELNVARASVYRLLNGAAPPTPR